MRAKFNALKRVLEQGLNKTAFNKTWQGICEEYEVGRIVGRHVHFTIEDRQYLRRMFITETGYDPQGGQITGDRLDVANISKNEKLSGQSVFGNLIQVARFNDLPISIKGSSKDTFTPSGTVLATRRELLSLHDINELIVVENGAVMSRWDEFLYPPDVERSLIIYRGHQSDAKHVAEILRSDHSIKKYVFSDCDPAGISMAISYGADGLIVPKDLSELAHSEVFKATNNPEKFYKQYQSLGRLKALLTERSTAFSKVFKDLIETVSANEVAIMQEHMLVKSLPLVLVPINP